ncbi:MAG: tRNA dimethylallyltransferase, partial [Thermoanaerobaculia bacterium]
ISSWNRPGDGEELPSVKIALQLDRADLVKALDARVVAMFEHGLVDETRHLLLRYPSTARPFDSIGYREAAAVVRGEMPLAGAIEETQRRTRAYAKRQMTWLRSERNVHWLDASHREELSKAALRLIEV